MNRRRLTAIDLFAGCGGLSRGFNDAGFDIVEAVESDFYAAATFKENFPDAQVRYRRLQYYRDVPPVDLVIGGPPCQGFSGLGKKDPADLRNRLWRGYARVVSRSECRVFVLENVDRFGESAEFGLLKRETGRGGLLEGFSIERHSLNAADFGVPQRRVRTVIIGSRVGEIGQPVPTHQRGDDGPLPKWEGLRDHIRRFHWDPWYTDLPYELTEHFGREVPGAFKLSDIHVGRNYSPLSRKRFQYIGPGGSRRDLPERLMTDCWRKHKTGAGDVLGRLEWDKPSVTIRTEFFKPEKGRYLHPDMDRAITHAEAAVIQGFDDRHLWCGPKVEIARMIGNAVPPPLAKAVARQVRRGLSA